MFSGLGSIFVYVLNCIQLFVAPWAVTCQVTWSMEFSRQEYQSGLPFLPPGELPDPGIYPEPPKSPASLALQADSLLLSHQGSRNHFYLLIK